MKETEINGVYEKVDQLFHIQLKAQIEGSEIIFKKLLSVKNLVSGQEYYVLFIDNDGINFTNQKELLNGLKKYINKELENINKEVKNYQYHMITDLVCDKQDIHYQLDRLGYRESKLDKIISQIGKQLLSENKN
ncbi:MAG: hypothetical protein Q8R96_06795 [Bacteroidota bacterium]|nr:hypothetical protein [Bacteroidota bacterium]